MSFDPTSIVPIIENCKKLYDYISDVKNSSAERRQLIDEVRSLQVQLEVLQELTNTLGIAGDQASMGQLAQVLDLSQPFAKVVDDTLARVNDVLTYGTSDPKAKKAKLLVRLKQGAAAVRWTVDKAEVNDLLSALERYKSRIVLALQHEMFKKQVVADGKLDVIEEHLGDKDRLDIAMFISESDFTGQQKGLLEQRLKNTGTWMIQHPDFVAWRDDKEPPRTLWCYGHPGAGKSVMAALIVDHLQSSGNVVLSVFCRYSSDNFTTPFPVLRGLLRQLIERSTTVPSTIRERYSKQIHPTPDDLPRFIAEAAAVHMRPIYIVIDALDECRISLELLRAIQQLGSSFRVLVTSRPVFNEMQKHTSVKIRASDDDVLVAVETTLSRLDYAWLDEELKSTIRVQVVEKADGMFLLASLQLRELECDVTCRHDVADILDSLPDTLDAAYEVTFQRICGQRKRSNILACRAIALIALHSPFLETKHVRHLLAEGDTAQYPEIETVLRCCHGLVHMDSPTKLAFIHYSVHEYIIMHWSELFPEHPNRIDMCLKLGFSTLQSLLPNNLNMMSWEALVSSIGKPEELSQVIPFLFTPEARASFIEFYAELPRFQRSLIEKRSLGTESWVLQHPRFIAWRDDRESPRTLSCDIRLVDRGRSIISALVIDHLQSRGDIVLSIFCRQRSSNTFTTSAALCILLRQLIEKSPNQSQPHRNPGTLSIFLDCLAASHEPPIYIVIDAIDECPFSSDFLPALQHLNSSFRILITLSPKRILHHSTKILTPHYFSPSNRVVKEIHEYSTTEATTKIYAADQDILTEIDTTLQELKHAWLDEELKSSIRVQVVWRADGVWDFASLLLRELKCNFASRRDVLATLDSLPCTLDDVYKLTFQRIREQGERKNKLACRILAIAASAMELDFATVQHLVAEGDRTQYTDIETIMLCCQGLVCLSPCEFIYHSAQDYTIAHWSELFPDNPNPINLCLQLALSTLTNKVAGLFKVSWYEVVNKMTYDTRKTEKLEQVISFLSTSAVRGLLVKHQPEIAHFVHDPFLIACYFEHRHVIQYMIETAPDVQLFNEALRLLKSHGRSDVVRSCKYYINERRDMRVNDDGVVVAVNPTINDARRIDVLLESAVAKLRKFDTNDEWMNDAVLKFVVCATRSDRKAYFDVLESLRSIPVARASLGEYQAWHYPLLVAGWDVIQHMIQAAPPDVDLPSWQRDMSIISVFLWK